MFMWIETTFLVANLKKFAHGGWITLVIGLLLISTMYIWYAGKKLKRRYKRTVDLNKFQGILTELSNDLTIPKYATHLVYLTISGRSSKIEERIIDSIVFQQPKRADLYWFVNVEVTDEPYTCSYTAEVVAPEDIIYVKFRLGFRIVPRLNLFFKKVVSEMAANKEVTVASKYRAVNRDYVSGDFRFIITKSFLSVENDLSFWDNMIMRLHFLLDKTSLPDDKAFGLDYNNVVVERVPLVLGKTEEVHLIREQ
jgi:KUP system potassium uptake protein